MNSSFRNLVLYGIMALIIGGFSHYIALILKFNGSQEMIFLIVALIIEFIITLPSMIRTLKALIN